MLAGFECMDWVRVDVEELGMLKVGQKVRYMGEVYRVEMVNLCRARLVPLRKQRVKIESKDGAGKRTFQVTGRAIDVAPTSILETVR